ncbi:hypothetical protein BGZ54_006055, partial [Gamsiella multidivaricata]
LKDLLEGAELVKMLEQEKCKDDNWFYKVECDEDDRLQRIFWMSPTQRIIYGRYRDVMVNDNTLSTNRFHMFFNASVVVDSDGKTRLVTCSLIRNET